MKMNVNHEDESSHANGTKIYNHRNDNDEDDDEDDEDDEEDDDDEDDHEDDDEVKPGDLQINSNTSTLHDMTRSQWQPGSWQDGTRRSAFQPYRPTMVLTNLQRGNIPTETAVPEQTDISLHHRAGQGEITEQEVLQENDVDVRDSNGLSALMWASAYGQVPTVQLLLQRGARVDLEGQEGATPLLLAAAGGHHEVVRLLLSEGAVVNHTDEVGNTALMFAAHGDHPHCVNELLLHGADVTLVNLNDDTAFGLAVKRGSKLAQAVIESYLLTLLS